MKESQEESNNSEDLRGNSSGSKEHSSSEEDKSDMEIDVGHKHAESSSFIMFTWNVKKYETNKRLHSTFNNVKKKTFKVLTIDSKYNHSYIVFQLSKENENYRKHRNSPTT